MKRRNNFYLSNILLAGALVLSFQSCSNGRNKDNIQSKELEEISPRLKIKNATEIFILKIQVVLKGILKENQTMQKSSLKNSMIELTKN